MTFVVITVRQKTALIRLCGGRWVLIDSEDIPKVIEFRWNTTKGKNGVFYAIAYKKGRHFLMHRLLTGAVKQIDHKNRNGLDNRKGNLRPCTQSLNNAKQKRNRVGLSSPFKGVYWDRKRKRWCSHIYLKNKRYDLGGFKDPKLAARAYDRWARKLFGEFALTNEDMGLLPETSFYA
jgi:hypothetical protein